MTERVETIKTEKTEEIEETNEIGWHFHNTFAQLSDIFFTKRPPTPVRSPKLIILNEPLANSLGLNPGKLREQNATDIFAGNDIPQDASPLAQAYAGHQYGHFTMLGDGRAILLGEQITPMGDRYDIQLKGSGRTPYSRGGDGRATLGPMLREYIISEAMYALGIPTTRSLAVVTTGEKIIRDGVLPGAVLTRVAASHIRVGTFEYISNWGTLEELKELADYTMNRHYPEVVEDENRYLSFLKKVVERQASLIAKWQLVGFIHGVMNTDNMAISGESIDYGPCAFMDAYDPSTVFSSIDTRGRYAYGQQPDMAVWNLARFAETLLPLLSGNADQAVGLANEALSGFQSAYHNNWLQGMRGKLGLLTMEDEDENLIKNLLLLMEKNQADYTNTFCDLTLDKPKDSMLHGTEEFVQWYDLWQTRVSRENQSKDAIHETMKKNNPAIIPRNHRVEEALEAAVNREDYSVTKQLIHLFANPYEYNDLQSEYSKLPEKADKCYRTFCGT